jgi:hypothetical protein
VILLSASAILVASTGLAGPDDVFAVAAPQVVRDSVTERFPGFVIWAIRTTGAMENTLYEITVFDSRSTSLHGQRVDGAMLHTRLTYKLVVSGTGKVVSEDRHPIPEDSVPRAALATFSKWRRSRPAGMAVVWGAYQDSHKERRYVANIIVNAVDSHVLVTNQEGIIIAESQKQPTDAR